MGRSVNSWWRYSKLPHNTPRCELERWGRGSWKYDFGDDHDDNIARNWNKPTNSHIEISWDSYPASRPNTMRCSNYPVMIQDRATTDVWVAFYVIKVSKLHLPRPLSWYSGHASHYLRWPGNVNTFDTAGSCKKKDSYRFGDSPCSKTALSVTILHLEFDKMARHLHFSTRGESPEGLAWDVEQVHDKICVGMEKQTKAGLKFSI